FYHLRLTAPMPPPRGCPRELRTLGDHLKKARLLKGLIRREAAAALGVSEETVESWETNQTEAAIWNLPGVVAFVGYDPREEPLELGGRIRSFRERQGLSRAALAEKLGLDVSTVAAWELGRVGRPFARVRRRFEEFLGEEV